MDEYRELRAVEHLNNLQCLARAARDIADGKMMSVAELRKRVDALVAKSSAKCLSSVAKRYDD